MTLDLSDEHAFEWLNIAIQEFENVALENHSRPAMLALAHGATYLSDTVLDAHERSLNRISDTRAKLKRDPTSEKKDPQPIQLVDADIDIESLFGGKDSPLVNYLEDCIGCNLRLKFDWQLKPLDLLAPINQFLDGLEASLDKILARIDPWRILEDLCWALDHLKTLCPQDLILVLLSLKALIKKYLLQMFSIRVDWTALLGPILQALISALTDLLSNIIALILAPLDCAVAGMKSANDLLRQSEDFINSMRSAGSQLDSFFSNLAKQGPSAVNIDLDPIYKTATWTKGQNLDDPLAFFNDKAEGGNPSTSSIGIDPGHLAVETSIGKPAPVDNALQIPAGFQIKPDMTIADALKDPTFINSTWLEKLIVPVQEVILWFKQTYQKLVDALNSLNGLVGAGLALSLDNAGIILFITDMVSVVLLIINLLKSNVGVKDWCSYLQENPQVLAEQARGLFGAPDLSVEARQNESTLLLRRGPNLVGQIKTCVNQRDSTTVSELKQWITELERRGQ